MFPYLPEGPDYVYVVAKRVEYLLRKTNHGSSGFFRFDHEFKCFRAENMDLDISQTVTFNGMDVWSMYVTRTWLR